jgi:oligoribonuclease
MVQTKSTSNILWLDLEMTGIDPGKDLILEVAAIVTDWDFKEVATFESGVGQEVESVKRLLDANPFYTKMKDNKTALLSLAAESPASAVVEQQLVQFVREHCDATRPVVLAGNSIHMDRRFIIAAWPLLDQLLHYRMLDVSAWKLVFEAKYGTKYVKAETHRALNDTRESIAELKKYLEYVHADA